MNRVGSVASLTLAFIFIVQYFLINKGIFVTSDIFQFILIFNFLIFCLFNDFALKGLAQTDLAKKRFFAWIFIVLYTIFL